LITRCSTQCERLLKFDFSLPRLTSVCENDFISDRRYSGALAEIGTHSYVNHITPTTTSIGADRVIIMRSYLSSFGYLLANFAKPHRPNPISRRANATTLLSVALLELLRINAEHHGVFSYSAA
jgi:hypothetical protein